MAKRRKGRAVDGVLLLDKPSGLTSNAILQKTRWIYQAQKAGHTGALDPMATGLLPICFGEATKFSRFLLDADKAYLATGCLGVSTDSYDADGAVTQRRPVPEFSVEQMVQDVLPDFVGEIQQVPPIYSALKRDGKKLYEYARQGQEVDIAPRPVTIFGLSLESMDLPFFTLRVHCSKGTYIRSLIADIGEKLGCGAHVTELRRTQHGQFHLDNALTLETIQSLSEQGPEALDQYLQSIDELLKDLPVQTLTDAQAQRFSCGNPVMSDADTTEAAVRVYDPQGRFLGVGEISRDQCLKPVRLIAQEHG